MKIKKIEFANLTHKTIRLVYILAYSIWIWKKQKKETIVIAWRTKKIFFDFTHILEEIYLNNLLLVTNRFKGKSFNDKANKTALFVKSSTILVKKISFVSSLKYRDSQQENFNSHTNVDEAEINFNKEIYKIIKYKIFSK